MPSRSRTHNRGKPQLITRVCRTLVLRPVLALFAYVTKKFLVKLKIFFLNIFIVKKVVLKIFPGKFFPEKFFPENVFS